MAQEAKEEVATLVARFPACITYVPVTGEVDFTEFLSLEGKTLYEIAPRRELDPLLEAERASEEARGKDAVVLVPGRQFDATGTRHGKGAGWYDRFLAVIPSSWVRIGFCTEYQFSIEPLVRQSWDEPMDYVFVVSEGSSPVFYTTHARPAML